MIVRFLKWFFFTLAISVLPLVAAYFALWYAGANPTRIEMLGSGELLTICCALAAASIGDILANKAGDETPRIILTALCGVVVVVTLVWYALISVEHFHGNDSHQNMVATGSIWLFLFTAITGAFCVGYSE